MPPALAHPCQSALTRQKGFTLMLVLLLVGVALSATLFSFVKSSAQTINSDKVTAAVLAQVKAALIGYALRGNDGASNPQRPGEFPCPDTNNDGFDNGTCVAGRLGRIPWKTLGIPEPKDGAGETLWYAVAGPFRSYNGGALNNNPINSDTRGNITVFAADGVTPITSQAVAVIFAAGIAFGGQSRDPTITSLCPTTGTTIAQNLCAANYLESSAGINNAITNGPYIVGRLRDPNNSTYNDRVMFITTPEFVPAVETRVAKELKTLLAAYRADPAFNCYPWAVSFAALNGTSVAGINRGRFPYVASPSTWGSGTIPSLPAWFIFNQWYNVIYYSVARTSTDGGGGGCTTCVDNTLSVNGVSGVNALFFTPGTPGTGITRPSTTLGDYLVDTQNNDGANDLYVSPSSQALNRNRIVTF